MMRTRVRGRHLLGVLALGLSSALALPAATLALPGRVAEQDPVTLDAVDVRARTEASVPWGSPGSKLNYCDTTVSLSFIWVGSGQPSPWPVLLNATCQEPPRTLIDAEGTFDGQAFSLEDGSYGYSGTLDGSTATISGGPGDITLVFQLQLSELPPPTPGPTPLDVRVDSGARFSDLSGQVEINVPRPDGTYDEEAWTFAKLDQVLPYGTHVKTSDRSSTILSFGDMTTFTMGPESEIVLDPPGDRPGHIELLYGGLKVGVRALVTGAPLEWEGSQAVAGIKGTVLVLEDSPAGTVLQVLEGTVTFTSKATGDAVTVEAGLGSTATEAGVSAPVPFDVDAVTADWAALEAGMAADGPPPSAEPTQETTVSPAPGVTTPPESTLLEVSDRAGKLKGGASEPTFTIDAPYLVTIIETFHWNGGRGATPGTIRLLTEGGDVMGPWQATGRPGPGDVADAYWVVEPGVVLPAGTYRIVDSEPATWTHSSWTKGLGYAEVRGRPSS